MSNLFAQVPVMIGDGTAVNGNTGSRLPTELVQAFRQQFLILASEFNNAGGGPGEISSVAFEVTDLDDATPMTNFRVRMKHTNQTSLTTTFEAGTYETLFQAASFMPTVGWNTHEFDAPFVWDGASNILLKPLLM